MTSDFVPEDVGQFILSKIGSIVQVEALLLFRADPQKIWNDEEIGARLYISRKEAAKLLAMMEKDFLVKEGAGYRYKPASEQLELLVSRLAKCYAEYLIPVTRLIHEKSKNRIQKFADAFRIRED